MIAVAAAVMLAAQPPELGLVKWSRGYEAAAARARDEKKPLLVLFDEVPGCSTVLGFGQRVLSHPLIADAIEHELVFVFVSNNSDGDDRRVLERFSEPAWNNPVVRLFTPDGRQTSRIDTGTAGEVAMAIAGALQASGRTVPGYLALLQQEEQGRTAVQRDYAMGCFWEGESTLGRLEGVVATLTGFVHGREVVRVSYAGEPGALDAYAHAHGYTRVSGGEFRFSPGDDKYQLKDTRLRFVPMTALQKTKLNSAPREVERWLSPRQLALYRRGTGEVLQLGDIVDAYRAATR
jgi:hypothetical protein